ncbi:MAG TPA: AAA family ATPase [Alphaproteobacteria bacterium]|nr:AAA family ATPase [Alphaproteobacteria bacterium]HOO50477.1 AAA family ATPase [Alphaproteobacteria bacterium]
MEHDNDKVNSNLLSDKPQKSFKDFAFKKNEAGELVTEVFDDRSAFYTENTQYETETYAETNDYVFLNPSSLRVHLPSAHEDAWSRLNGLIGLDEVKKQIKRVEYVMNFDKKRQESGLTMDRARNHFAFLGNPGTGKNEVARILGNILYQSGVVSNGHVVEVDRSDLVMGYIGQTAIKTKEIVDYARGGVLFIDEAYSLWDPYEGDFGAEAVGVLMKEMEDSYSDLVVVLAGYEDDMDILLRSNAGITSRIRHQINFEDYSPEELFLIYKKFCQDNQYILHADAEIPLKKLMNETEKLNNARFGNARYVRNIFDKTIEKMAERVTSQNLEDLIHLQTILFTDIPQSTEIRS